MPAKSHTRNSAFARAYAVIMAGGSGTRFWPLSRRRQPKQLLDFFGQASLLEQSLARIRGAIPPGRTYVFTSDTIRAEVARRLPGVPAAQIVAEPAQRNTAPTIALAAHEVLRRDPEGIMVILPSDHVIRKTREFLKSMEAGCDWARSEGRSVVLGIKPDSPQTGYGYLKMGRVAGRAAARKIFQVENFTEKPDLATARKYTSSGRYLWNAGMFIWRASTLIRNLERFQPAMARQLEKIMAAGGIRNRRALRRLFPQLEKISIDYALMEKIPQVYAVAADIGWSDVGSWSVVYGLNRRDAQGNVLPQNSLAIASTGNMIVSPRKFVAAVGVQNLVVVETDDALLICAQDRSQDVGKAVQELEKRGLKKLL
jgi:mannose-1-phosphate guanylyltransferase